MQLTPAQREAVDLRDGSALVSAGAGTGKTSVLVERFVQAVLEDGVAVDSVLAITFTEKAAAQLTTRVRGRFAELGAREEARQAESAWISTVHGFCARVLRTHALAAGIDPEFRVLDAVEAERVALDAFDRALAEFLAGGLEDERLRLIAAHTPDRLADMLRTAYSHLRSQGQREPALPDPVKPPVGGEREALASAAQAALREIGASEGKTVASAREKLERCAGLLNALAPGEIGEPADYAKLSFAGGANALKGTACDEFRAAHEAWHELSVRHRAHSDHILLRDLMTRYGRLYTEGKRRRSGLDFDDLELLARDLLAGNEAVCNSYAERFTHVMVDEFQDTNPLQNELLGLLDRDNLFRVGDERQSIYRFRHADVGLFREQRSAAAAEGRERSIAQSFRSRGEVLDAIDLVFEGLWGEEFRPLEPGPDAWAAEPRVSPCVELLVTDRHKGRWDARFKAQIAAGEEPFGSAMRGYTPWRAAEARLLARRVSELTTHGPFEYGEVVLLMRATTHIGAYERALEERGIPTYVLGGRGYWSQQQVGDLRAYLAALANPLDELALLSVLGSPFVGLSLDTLVILATARGSRRELWSALGAVAEGESRAELPAADARRIEGFVERFRGERSAAPRVSIETLIDGVVTGSGYDRAILAMPAGDRRMANARKLMRMAREFEAEEGRDLRRFIDFVAERDLITEREGHAPLEAEDLDAVKLMTIHRAKGLEFPVVCVADLGKGGREDDAALRISDDGRLGMRLASLGGEASDSADLKLMKEQGKLDDEEEERRIFYVAATRAQEHLVLSGATDLEKLAPPAALEEPMRWLWPALAPGLAEMGATGEAREPYAGREVAVRCEVLRPETLDELLPEHDREPARPEPEPPGLEALTAPALGAVAVPEALPVSRLSYSSLARYERCGYRFYLERALRLPAAGAREDARRGSSEPAGETLPGVVRGSVVHALLESLDFSRPRLPEPAEVADAIRVTGEPVRDSDVRDQIAMVEGFVGSALFGRLSRASSVRAEQPFGFTLDAAGGSLLIDGVVDVRAHEPDGLLVVDYKSDRLEGREPAELVEASYATQRLVYALAALRSGAARVEVAYVFLERPDEPLSAVFDAADAPECQQRLLSVTEGVVAGRFEPSATPHRGLCAGCPGQSSLCVWGPERTNAEIAS